MSLLLPSPGEWSPIGDSPQEGSPNVHYLHYPSLLGSAITWTHTSQSQQNCPMQSKEKSLPLPHFGRVFPVCSWQRVGHCSKTWPDFSGGERRMEVCLLWWTCLSQLMPTHKISVNYSDWLLPWWILTQVWSPVTCWHIIQLDPNDTWRDTCSVIPGPFQSPTNLQSCKVAQCFGDTQNQLPKPAKIPMVCIPILLLPLQN